MADNTAEVGKTLEIKYGGSHPQDLHIEYFFLLLGSKIRQRKKKDIIDALNKVDGIHVWGNIGAEWSELWLSECPKISPLETERQREERLNHDIRIRLLAEFTDPKNPPRIIISRACKYETELVKHSLSTSKIENILKTPNNEHSDCFYLMIKPRDIPSTVALPSSIILAPLIPGNWRAVETEDAWPHTFIGHFPKKFFETEREREWRLNQEVRLPLKQSLGSLLNQGTQGIYESQKLIRIVFTRVCTYTDM